MFNKEQPWFLMTVGLPGSGKTEWINRELVPYLAQNNCYAEVLSTDEIVQHIAGVTKQKYKDIFKDVISESVLIVDSRITLSSYMGLNIILDQTNLTPKSRQRKLSLLSDRLTYFKIAVIFDGEYGNTKDIDPEVIKNMKERYQAINGGEQFDDVLTVNEFKLKYMSKRIKDDVSASSQKGQEESA